MEYMLRRLYNQVYHPIQNEMGDNKRSHLVEDNPELANYMLSRLYNQAYHPIVSEDEMSKGERVGEESPEVDQNAISEYQKDNANIPDPDQNLFKTQVGNRMWDKRVEKSDEIYRLLRTMRRNTEGIVSGLTIDGKHIPTKKLKHVLVRMV